VISLSLETRPLVAVSGEVWYAGGRCTKAKGKSRTKILLKGKGADMGDKGKRDRGKREEQKKGKHTLKEKRKLKRDKTKPV
jgi:hypothetical protein